MKRVIRRIAKRLSRGIVLKRHLPREFGGVPVLVSPECALGYWRFNLASVDPFLLSMAKELVRPGMTVWDVGANAGLFCFAAAGLGAQVVAVEADTWLANLLHRSALLNRLPVTVLPAADAVVVHKVDIDKDETPNVSLDEFMVSLGIFLDSHCDDCK